MNKKRGNPNWSKKQPETKKEIIEKPEIIEEIKQKTEIAATTVDNTILVETEKSDEVKPTRPPKRKPMFSRVRLKYPKVIVKDGVKYYTRVFNDVNDRIIRAEEAGYMKVLKSDMPGRDDRCGAASQIGEPVVVPVGRGMNGVLMMIPEQWHNEDQEARKRYLDEREADIMKPSSTAGYGKVTQEVEN